MKSITVWIWFVYEAQSVQFGECFLCFCSGDVCERSRECARQMGPGIEGGTVQDQSLSRGKTAKCGCEDLSFSPSGRQSSNRNSISADELVHGVPDGQWEPVYCCELTYRAFGQLA